jgi:phosphoglucosamine mutase
VKIDGDQLMALIAQNWASCGKLKGGTLITTVMSNLGLERFLTGRKIAMHRTPVGDRYVVEAMREKGCNLGGEQSGHIVLSDYSPTGDGLIAALQILAAIRAQDKPASEVCRLFTPLPQILVNVKAPGELLDRPAIKEAISKAELALNGTGRLLIRKSGTEPLIRVMAEGDDEKLVKKLVDEIAGVIKDEAA